MFWSYAITMWVYELHMIVNDFTLVDWLGQMHDCLTKLVQWQCYYLVRLVRQLGQLRLQTSGTKLNKVRIGHRAIQGLWINKTTTAALLVRTQHLTFQIDHKTPIHTCITYVKKLPLKLVIVWNFVHKTLYVFTKKLSVCLEFSNKNLPCFGTNLYPV